MEIERLKEMVNGKTVLVIPRMKDTDLQNNTNLASSPLITLVNLATSLGADKVVTNIEKEFGAVLSLFSGDDIKNEYYKKAISKSSFYIEVAWCPLNGKFFVERLYGCDAKSYSLDTANEIGLPPIVAELVLIYPTGDKDDEKEETEPDKK